MLVKYLLFNFMFCTNIQIPQKCITAIFTHYYKRKTKYIQSKHTCKNDYNI